MSAAGKDGKDLSPDEKRLLLAELLRKKAKGTARDPSRMREPSEVPDQFGMSVVDLNAHAVLDPTIDPGAVPFEPVATPARIFLTGATGFLGAFLLHELLRQTPADMYCLVRAATREEGMRRIQDNLELYAPGTGYQSGRVIPVTGDLSKPLLGLSADQFEQLAREIDTVYHNGAFVHWIYPYSQLKPANVLGTQEILRLASHGKVKPVHFVSSVSVFPLVGHAMGTVIREHDSLDHGGVLYGGYTQSKWVAEKLVTIAASRGLPVSVYRPGLITGDSQAGAWNTDDFLSGIIKSWIELGAMPDLDAATDMTPVDYLSRAIVHLSRLRQSPGKVFHLTNPRAVHLSELAAGIRSFGYPLEVIPYDRWRTKLIDRTMGSRAQAMRSLMSLFSGRLPEQAINLVGSMLASDEQKTLDRLGTLMATQYATSAVRFDCQNTLDGLAGTGIVCPPVDSRLLDTYFSYFARCGFVEAPRHGRTMRGA